MSTKSSRLGGIMLDDIRDHDAKPTPEEEDWMGVSAVGLVLRALALAGVALCIGVSASVVIDSGRLTPSVASGPGR